MSFYNTFLNLCIKKDIKPTAAVKEIGITGPAVNRWKNGSMPNDVTLMKIANYFDVSMEYLKTGEEPETEKSQPAEIDKLANSEIKKKLVEYFDTLPEEKLIALLALIKPTDN